MDFEEIYPKCRSLLGNHVWECLVDVKGHNQKPERFPDRVEKKASDLCLPDFLPNLAQLEWAVYKIRSEGYDHQEEIRQISVNPTLQILELKWKNLTSLILSDPGSSGIRPEPGDEMVLVWCHPKTGEEFIEAADKEDLLVLKMIIEEIGAEDIAINGKVPIGAVDTAINQAVQKGLLLMPESRIRRDPPFVSKDPLVNEQPQQAKVFTLQWHVTQACDLNCKHCYDRSERSPLKMEQALKILDDFRAFCRSRYVHGQVSFSGGNPLLYPHFSDLYGSASERGLSVAILGNPSPRSRIEELIAIHKPVFFQVSLEGLQKHNDFIRGPGHFERVIEFLKVLDELDIYSMVMLTLTKDNIHQILPLAEILRNLADSFTFNRLSMVGEGANLQLPTRDEFSSFLEDYLDASERNPIIGLKDNLINIVRHRRGIKLTGGCTGFGCGAAFNFLTLLPDGEVHACRKFPSLMGNAFEDSLSDIYDSELGRLYRSGPDSCKTCIIRPSCGGCLASAYSHGLDIFTERDPYCFINKLG